MGKFFHEEHGNILALTAAILFTLLLFAAAAIDIGYILTAKNQLQVAVDAAALAGCAGLIMNSSYAANQAIAYAAKNNCLNHPVQLEQADITFPNANRIRIQKSITVNTFFLHLAGMPNKTITATAQAELGYIQGTTGLRPWAIPDGGWRAGDRVILKSGGQGELGTTPCWHYPVDYPPLNRGNPIPGAKEYCDNIKYGTDAYVEIGDILQVEPGNMIGPTKHGVDYILDQDPHAYYSNSHGLLNSAFPGFSSPRVVILPLYDPNHPPANGRGDIVVTGLAAFFVEGMQGKDVLGVFLQITNSGKPGNVPGLLRKVRLVSESS